MRDMFTNFDTISIAGATSDLSRAIGGSILADKLTGTSITNGITPDAIIAQNVGTSQASELTR